MYSSNRILQLSPCDKKRILWLFSQFQMPFYVLYNYQPYDYPWVQDEGQNNISSSR